MLSIPPFFSIEPWKWSKNGLPFVYLALFHSNVDVLLSDFDILLPDVEL